MHKKQPAVLKNLITQAIIEMQKQQGFQRF